MLCVDERARALLDQYEEEKATPQKILATSASTPANSSHSAQAAVFTTASAAALTPQLDKILALTQQFADQAKITNAKLDQQQQEINFSSRIPFNLPIGLISRCDLIAANSNNISAGVPVFHHVPTLARILPLVGIPSRG